MSPTFENNYKKSTNDLIKKAYRHSFEYQNIVECFYDGQWIKLNQQYRLMNIYKQYAMAYFPDYPVMSTKLLFLSTIL